MLKNLQSKKEESFALFLKSYQMQLDALEINKSHIQQKNVEKAVSIILQCKGKLVLTGMGKSGLIAQKLSATFSSTGTPAFFLHPGESLHGDLGVLQKDDVLVLLAKSGESEEVIAMLQAVKKMGNPIISILGNPESTAGRMSTVIVRATVHREADSLNLAPTASTTVSLVVGDALATAVSEKKHFKPEHFAMYHPGGQLGKRLLLNVEDILTTGNGIPIIDIDATMAKLLEAESKPNLGGVMVVNKKGKLLGIVTDGDIRRGIMANNNILQCPIKDIMTANPLVAYAGMRALEALDIMENGEKQISVLPVLDTNKRPIGLLRLHDFVNARLS